MTVFAGGKIHENFSSDVAPRSSFGIQSQNSADLSSIVNDKSSFFEDSYSTLSSTMSTLFPLLDEFEMQECRFDNNGNVLNIAGSCLGECFKQNQYLRIYDIEQGYCCCGPE